MRKLIRTTLIIFAALICTSCGPSLEDRVGELVAAKDVWVSVAGEKPYSYTLKFGNKGPYTVSVSNPRTLRENWLEEPECSEFGECRVTPSMRELFQFVLELTEDQLESGGDLSVVYDDKMGFPNHIFFDDHRGFHSAFSIEVSDVIFTQE